MPTNRNKRPRYSKPSLSKELQEYLETGNHENETIDLFVIRTDRKKMQSVWNENKEKILEKWIIKYPGFRPFAWWKFDSPETRQRLGCKGLPPWECGNSVKPIFYKGVPEDWTCIINGKVTSFDRSDTPTFESEASYLKRHNLLTSAEEKIIGDNPELLAPVAITEIFDF